MLQTSAMLLTKIDGLDYKTLKSLFSNAVEDLGSAIVNHTDKALQNTLFLELVNKYMQINNVTLNISETDISP